MELNFIFLIIFGVVSVVYLFTLSKKPSMFQYILKGCLMPLLLSFYITSAGYGNIFLPVVLALIFAWIGDVLLVRITNMLWFKLGLLSFLIGHIFYIIAMYEFIQPVNITVLIISVIVAAFLGAAIYKIIKPSKQMKIPVIAYETVILLMTISALQLFILQFTGNGYIFGLFIFAGSLCFLISDTLLAIRTFRRVKIYFGVMITYIAAQFLIALGFIMANMVNII